MATNFKARPPSSSSGPNRRRYLGPIISSSLWAGAAALHRPSWFFPACLVIVGAHYLPFVFLYGMCMWKFAALAAAFTAPDSRSDSSLRTKLFWGAEWGE